MYEFTRPASSKPINNSPFSQEKNIMREKSNATLEKEVKEFLTLERTVDKLQDQAMNTSQPVIKA